MRIGTVTVVVIFLLIVLFTGDPDLHDALVQWAFAHAGGKP